MADFPLGAICKTFSSGIGSVSDGITITSSSTANTKGSWIELDASTEAEVSGFTINITDIAFASAAPHAFLIDIGIGGAGSEEVLISDLHLEEDNAAANASLVSFDFPISVPAGSRISARCQTETTDADAIKLLLNFLVPSFMSHEGHGAVISYGANTSTTNGTTVDAGGSTNTKGAWSEFTTSSDELAGTIVSVGVNQNVVLVNASFLLDIGIGSAGNEEVVVFNMPVQTFSNERLHHEGTFYPISIPASTRIAIRSQSTTANVDDRVLSVVLHGVK